MVGGDAGSARHTSESLGKLNDVVRCCGRCSGELEHGRSSGEHRTLDTHLRDKSHYFGYLGEGSKGILAEVFFQGHVYLVGGTDKAFEAFDAILSQTEFCTGIGNTVKFLDGGSGVNLREIEGQFIDVLHS